MLAIAMHSSCEYFLLSLSDSSLIVFLDIVDCNVSTLKSGQKISKILKKPNLGHLSHPCTIVDKKGHILLWYLPEILPKDHCVSYFFS